MSKLSKNVKDDKFIFNPTDNLFVIIDDQVKAARAIDNLISSGFAKDDITTFQGELGARQIDADGSKHGRISQIIRWRQGTTPARQDAERYEQAVNDGNCVIAIETKTPETRETARQILKAHSGYFINFYGRFTMQNLDS